MVGEFEASLAIVTLSEILPVADGANVTFRVTTWPGAIISPFEMPEASKPEPPTVTLETVMLTAPEFVKVTPRVLPVLPTATSPKLRAAGLALSAAEGTELGVADVEFVELVVTEAELPLAEVTPAQPERITTEAKRVRVRKTICAGTLGRACG